MRCRFCECSEQSPGFDVCEECYSNLITERDSLRLKVKRLTTQRDKWRKRFNALKRGIQLFFDMSKHLEDLKSDMGIDSLDIDSFTKFIMERNTRR